MPWEKSFDVDAATDQAIGVFQRKGYAGASIADLVAAIGVNKGSLYNAFGGKSALFRRALERYEQLNLQAFLDALSDHADPVDAIGTLFDGLIEAACADAPNTGCLIVNTAVEWPTHDAAVRDAVKAALDELEAFFRVSIVRGREQGRIAAHVDPDGTAKALLALVLGIRVLARGVDQSAALNGVRTAALTLLGR